MEELKLLGEKLDFVIQLLEKPNEVFTLLGASEYLKVSESFLRRKIKAGEIRFKKKGSDYLFRKVWLDEWMER